MDGGRYICLRREHEAELLTSGAADAIFIEKGSTPVPSSSFSEGGLSAAKQLCTYSLSLDVFLMGMFSFVYFKMHCKSTKAIHFLLKCCNACAILEPS